MSQPQTLSRRQVGESIAPFDVQTLAHGALCVPGPKLLHLQFRRFAGCPVCNLHLRRFAAGQAQLTAAGVQTVAFFHSPADLMRPYQGDLPFPCVPDPERHWYQHFGVERSALAVFHPQVIGAAIRGLFTAPSNPLAGGSDQSGLPADFLLDNKGEIVGARYGRHADDQWSVEEVVALAHFHHRQP
jgi:peroxiredoxin